MVKSVESVVVLVVTLCSLERSPSFTGMYHHHPKDQRVSQRRSQVTLLVLFAPTSADISRILMKQTDLLSSKMTLLVKLYVSVCRSDSGITVEVTVR
jgi:hypothetical protein